MVFPPSIALWELREFLTDIEDRAKFGEPYEIPIAPDFYHKSGVSGGPPYTLAVPSEADDPTLNRSQDKSGSFGDWVGASATPKHRGENSLCIFFRSLSARNCISNMECVRAGLPFKSPT